MLGRCLPGIVPHVVGKDVGTGHVYVKSMRLVVDSKRLVAALHCSEQRVKGRLAFSLLVLSRFEPFVLGLPKQRPCHHHLHVSIALPVPLMMLQRSSTSSQALYCSITSRFSIKRRSGRALSASSASKATFDPKTATKRLLRRLPTRSKQDSNNRFDFVRILNSPFTKGHQASSLCEQPATKSFHG